MITSYSDNELHMFVRKYIKSIGGELKDACEDYFTIKRPEMEKPKKYTYKPAIAREENIELMAKGSWTLKDILDNANAEGLIALLSRRHDDRHKNVLHYAASAGSEYVAMFADAAERCGLNSMLKELAGEVARYDKRGTLVEKTPMDFAKDEDTKLLLEKIANS